jgi:hypothetical protein
VFFQPMEELGLGHDTLLLNQVNYIQNSFPKFCPADFHEFKTNKTLEMKISTFCWLRIWEIYILRPRTDFRKITVLSRVSHINTTTSCDSCLSTFDIHVHI